MLYKLLYVTAPDQLAQVVTALERMNATPLQREHSVASLVFELRNRLLGNITLEIALVQHLDAVPAHLRTQPVDLLIYDERGAQTKPAIEAILQIRRDVRALSELWGPDVLFPMSRVVAILAHEAHQAERAFELGRLNVRDVCAAPKSTSVLLLWLKRVLTQGVLRRPRIGMALSGGGMDGLCYQLGCLVALESAFNEGVSLRDAHVVSGVSSGAIAGSVFAAKVPLEEIIASLQGRSKILPALTTSTIFDIAGLGIAKRVLKESLSWGGINPQKWIEKTSRAIPTGFFKGEGLESFFRTAFASVGLRDRFEDFGPQLYIGATDQDSFEHVIFGETPWDKVPVSEAVRASIAIPPLFVPKHINGRWFIDGQVTKTSDLELVVDKGCSLVVVINPIRPHASNVPGTTDKQGGVYGLIQTVKALVATRFHSSFAHLSERYPDVDFVVLEPDEECARVMAGSPVRNKLRIEVIQLGYECTLRRLRERHAIYLSKFGRYGMRLKTADELMQMEKINIINGHPPRSKQS